MKEDALDAFGTHTQPTSAHRHILHRYSSYNSSARPFALRLAGASLQVDKYGGSFGAEGVRAGSRSAWVSRLFS